MNHPLSQLKFGPGSCPAAIPFSNNETRNLRPILTKPQPLYRAFVKTTKAFSLLLFAAFTVLGSLQELKAQDWITKGSYYTHDPVTKKRVHQYRPDPVVVHSPDPYKRVYRHTRIHVQVGNSFDTTHTVETYGGIVRPYGEWQRPFRPYSVPYSDWAYGSPFGHLAYPRRTNPTLPNGIYGPTFFPSYGYIGPGGVPFTGPAGTPPARFIPGR